MTTVKMSVNLFGDNFSPSEFMKFYKGCLMFSSFHEKGDISELRNKPLEYGYASADCSKKPVDWEKTEGFIDEISNLEPYIASMKTKLKNFIGRSVADLRDRKKHFKYEISVCAIFKNEARYLQEWLEFHYGVGVRHFYLYNDASEDNYMEVLQTWIDRGVVTLIDWFNGTQTPAYNHCINNYRLQAKWIAFIDLDEFLFSPTGAKLPVALEEFSGLPVVFVYWVMFGSSGHDVRPNGSVIESYTHCMDLESAINDNFDHGKSLTQERYVTGWSRHGKSIVNPRLVKRYNVHKPRELWRGDTLDENGNVPRLKAERGIPSYNKLRINHYWSKSIQDITEKVSKGDVYDKSRPKRNLERWLAREELLNASKDNTILKVIDDLNIQLHNTMDKS